MLLCLLCYLLQARSAYRNDDQIIMNSASFYSVFDDIIAVIGTVDFVLGSVDNAIWINVYIHSHILNTLQISLRYLIN